MLKILRSATSCPASLRASALRNESRDLKEHYSSSRDVRGSRRAPFEYSRFMNRDVINALHYLFQGKCAYCETTVSGSEQSIDHFRPRSGASDFNSHSPDHYGWFAYEWKNLLIACGQCLKAKANHFPVDGPRARLLCTWREANETESPLLLNPCEDDPLLHFRLDKDGYLLNQTDRGAMTIDMLSLNRVDLRLRRSDIIDKFLNQLSSHNDELPLEFLRDDLEFRGIKRILIRSIFDYFPRAFKKWRITSSSFDRILDELFESTPNHIWSDAVFEFKYKREALISREIIGKSNRLVFPKELFSLEKNRLASRSVSSISLSNFKGFENFTFHLKESQKSFQTSCAILLGENSTGKSTLLQALCLALMSPDQRKKMKLDPEDFISRQKSNWYLVERVSPLVEVIFDDNTMVTMTIDVDSPSFIGDGAPSIVVLAYGARRYFKVGVDDKKSSAVNQSLFDPLATISDATRWLEECSHTRFEAVARAMNEVLALQRDDRIFKDDDGRVQVKAHGRDTPIQKMSDGYKSLFAMAIDVMRRMLEKWNNLEEARGIVLIDEVETHLHPRWKMQVMGALRRAMPQVQFIVTTHDPLCLRGMNDGEVHVFARNDQNEIVQLQDLPSVIGLRTEQLLTSDYFGLASTSDPELEKMLQNYTGLAKSPAISRDASLLGKIKDQISEITVIGDTTSQQIVSEALARYLVQASNKSIDRKAMREDAIQTILSVLNNSLREMTS